MARDYSSISPSARSLFLTKGLTDIPYMATAAKMVWGDATHDKVGERTSDNLFLARLIHFEARYKSLQNLLMALGGKNILEISSGFSFRGLDMAVRDNDVFYIDTDLPNIIDDKTDLVMRLMENTGLELKGELIIQALNALNEDDFIALTDKLPDGPVSIINEGLLMYLNEAEKKQLCSIIRKVLLARGGYWITADIYIKKKLSQDLPRDEFNKFLEAHDVEQNKFDDYTQAERFFNEQGFKLFRKAEPLDGWQISAFKYVNEEFMQSYVSKIGGTVRIRETWALAAV